MFNLISNINPSLCEGQYELQKCFTEQKICAEVERSLVIKTNIFV
jgi:hypothetical protein